MNLAAALAMHGLRVLVVDLDPQGNASTALGADLDPHRYRSLFFRDTVERIHSDPDDSDQNLVRAHHAQVTPTVRNIAESLTPPVTGGTWHAPRLRRTPLLRRRPPREHPSLLRGDP